MTTITTSTTEGTGDQPAPAATAQTTRTKYPEEPRTVLVADDEHLVATGVAASLREMGYAVVGPAADGEEAIEICRKTRPDLALVDIRMPKADGLAVAEHVFRQMGIPVVIFSAYSDAEYIKGGRRVGVFGYLLKPVTHDQLRVCISMSWGRFLEHVGQHAEITRLKDRLESRKIVEQAKWILVKRKGLSEPDAMKLLQRQARNSRRPIRDIAQGLLENEEMFGE